MVSPRLCLVGAGNMGGAMLGGWLAAGHDPAAIEVIDPQPPAKMEEMIKKAGIDLLHSTEGVSRPDLIIVAVKPQIITDVLPDLSEFVDSENVLLSVAAGTTMRTLSAPFEDKSPRIIRAMPNTPAMVKRGITVCVANDRVDDRQCTAVTQLLSAIGDVEWIEDETLMDAVTGVSGSGPAYVFYLAEALAKAGAVAGLPPGLAGRLANATVSGAGQLIRQSDHSPAVLRENVSSPNGTTEAALEVLMGEDGVSQLLERAVAAAVQRSRELTEER